MSRSRAHRQRQRLNAITRDAQRACADHFEPLWRCAPYVFGRRGLSALDAANMKEAAKRTAFAWLSERMGIEITSFEDIASVDVLRRCYGYMAGATIKTVQTWADNQEASI